MNRIYIVGTTGSGKTTLASALSVKSSIPHIELDAIYWQAEWTPQDEAVFRNGVLLALHAPQWIVEGNYRAVRDDILEQIDTLVWLDYPLAFVFFRLLKRTVRRLRHNEILWGTNRESLLKTLSRRSILLWCLQTHYGRRRMYSALAPALQSRGVTVHRLRSPRATGQWLHKL